MKDMFETPELWTKELDTIMSKYEDSLDYDQCAQMLSECEQIGLTFEYYLTAEPYGLRPIGTPLNQLEGFEDIN